MYTIILVIGKSDNWVDKNAVINWERDFISLPILLIITFTIEGEKQKAEKIDRQKTYYRIYFT